MNNEPTQKSYLSHECTNKIFNNTLIIHKIEIKKFYK